MRRKYFTVEEELEARRQAVRRFRIKKRLKTLEEKGRRILKEFGIPKLTPEERKKMLEELLSGMPMPDEQAISNADFISKEILMDDGHYAELVRKAIERKKNG